MKGSIFELRLFSPGNCVSFRQLWSGPIGWKKTSEWACATATTTTAATQTVQFQNRLSPSLFHRGRKRKNLTAKKAQKSQTHISDFFPLTLWLVEEEEKRFCKRIKIGDFFALSKRLKMWTRGSTSPSSSSSMVLLRPRLTFQNGFFKWWLTFKSQEGEWCE